MDCRGGLVGTEWPGRPWLALVSRQRSSWRSALQGFWLLDSGCVRGGRGAQDNLGWRIWRIGWRVKSSGPVPFAAVVCCFNYVKWVTQAWLNPVSSSLAFSRGDKLRASGSEAQPSTHRVALSDLAALILGCHEEHVQMVLGLVESEDTPWVLRLLPEPRGKGPSSPCCPPHPRLAELSASATSMFPDAVTNLLVSWWSLLDEI